MPRLNVAVVGGSIAGCSAAILFERAGHQVRVFERSRGPLAGHGGGIRIPGTLFDELVGRDLIDADVPRVSCASMPFVTRTPEEARLGRAPWSQPIDLHALHWTALWGTLRRRVPDLRYHSGVEVVGSAPAVGAGERLTFADGSTADFDLIVFADGARSLGRQILAPGLALTYRGYLLWRGLTPEAVADDTAPLERAMVRVSCPHLPGHFVAYFVPSFEGSTRPGERLVNWAAYLPVPETELPAFMEHAGGDSRTGPAVWKLRPGAEHRLWHLLGDHLPTFYGDLVTRSRAAQVQLMHTIRMPAYRRGRLCVIGDAGVVAPPFTGSGVFKGYHNVVDLLAAIETRPTLDGALEEWHREQVRLGNRLLALAEQMEQALIWNPIDLATANATTAAAWWKQAVTFPRDFTYEAND